MRGVMNDQLTFILPGDLDRAKLKEIYEDLYPVYDEILQSLYQRVRTVLEDAGRFPTITHRVKRFAAYFDKLVKLSRHEPGGDAGVASGA